MKVLRNLVFILFGAVVVSALLTTGSAQTGKASDIEDNIELIESAVNNGQVITDGMIEGDKNPNAKPNAIGEGATKVGGTIVDGFTSFLKMVGEMIFEIF